MWNIKTVWNWYRSATICTIKPNYSTHLWSLHQPLTLIVRLSIFAWSDPFWLNRHTSCTMKPARTIKASFNDRSAKESDKAPVLLGCSLRIHGVLWHSLSKRIRCYFINYTIPVVKCSYAMFFLKKKKNNH